MFSHYFLFRLKNLHLLLFVSITGIYGYHGNKKIPFLKVTVALPRLIAPSKRLLEQGFQCPGYPVHAYQTYESNIDFEIR